MLICCDVGESGLNLKGKWLPISGYYNKCSDFSGNVSLHQKFMFVSFFEKIKLNRANYMKRLLKRVEWVRLSRPGATKNEKK